MNSTSEAVLTLQGTVISALGVSLGRAVFWEMMVFAMVRKKVCLNMCLIPNGFRDGAVSIYWYKSNVDGNKG